MILNNEYLVALDNDNTVSILKCNIIKPQPVFDSPDPAEIEQEERIPIGSRRRPGQTAQGPSASHGASQGQQMSGKLQMRTDDDTDMEPANAEENDDLEENPRGQGPVRNQPINSSNGRQLP